MQSIVTWFGWLIAFGCLAAMIQFVTTGFCVAVYARQLLRKNTNEPSTSDTTASGTATSPTTPSSNQPSSQFGTKRLAWRRVHKVLLMQWRSIALSVLIIIECLYFGTVYVAQTRAGREAGKPEHVPQIQAWITCLVMSTGDKAKCLHLAAPLGINENTVVASLFIISVSARPCILFTLLVLTRTQLIGLFTFCLMFRFSMLTGWLSLLRNPKRGRAASAGSVGDFVLINRPSEGKVGTANNGTGVLPSPEKESLTAPEPGDVSKRHETTNLFEDSDGGDEKKEPRVERDDVV